MFVCVKCLIWQSSFNARFDPRLYEVAILVKYENRYIFESWVSF